MHRNASLTTSPPSPSHTPPRATAQVAGSTSRPQTPASPRSPALSTASTADAGPSPALPALPAPRLPDRILSLLRTPPSIANERVVEDNDDHFVTASWGSPYPRSDTSHLRLSSSGSELSGGSSPPIHHLEIRTPFLRPAPFIIDAGEEAYEDEDSRQDSLGSFSSPLPSENPSSLVSAAVLANRARRPARGLTEDWIRQHTAGDIGSEACNWLSEGSGGDSETSSLSGSVSGKKPAWSNENDEDDESALRTPRAAVQNRQIPDTRNSQTQNYHLRRQPSSIETLREADISRLNRQAQMRHGDGDSIPAAMLPVDTPGATIDTTQQTAAEEAPFISVPSSLLTSTAKSTSFSMSNPVSTPLSAATPPQAASGDKQNGHSSPPQITVDPPADRPTLQMQVKSPRKERSAARRLKKKLPWNGKSILILLPLDEERGKPGKAPVPLTQDATEHMLRSWKELGYDIDGFDLDRAVFTGDVDNGLPNRAMSRSPWPNEQDIARERAFRKFPVVLPDLNAWKNYVDELNEAKLRALGVSFGDDEPPLPPPPKSVSPGIGASISRQSSATMYPPLPFSPPIPTSSASSNQAGTPFAFPAPFVPGSSAIQSPGIPSVASPLPFGMGSRVNTRQSISIPAGAFQMQHPPRNFSPQALLLQQGLARGGSPSLATLSVMSPTSPFSSEGFPAPPLHQRHQSLQYPMMQYQQLQSSARASPRLQDLREVDEESPNTSLSKTPEAANTTGNGVASSSFIKHNASLSLQKEIDDAEYHLEEQFRSQFEHDRDYSPHGERESAVAMGVNGSAESSLPQHARDLSVQFVPPPIQRFRDDAESGPPLHHPRPHSRGHSLANAYFADPDEMHGQAEAIGFPKAIDLPSENKLQNGARVDESYEIETNPSNLGTPVQALDLSTILKQQSQQHQRAFSTTSNPWNDSGSFSGKQSTSRQASHGSKASLSRLNVDAPEFKFNPGGSSTFKPNTGSQFLFGNGVSEAFTPAIFQAGLATDTQTSNNPSQFSFPISATTSSKINVNAPAFSPGQSEFSFSSLGPKFRPDAPSFTPLHSVSGSLTSPLQSGSESITGGNRTSSIFGNIDLSIPDVIMPAKRSKAVPIVRPVSRHSPKPELNHKETVQEPAFDENGRILDDSRVKRARASPKDDDDNEVLFAEPEPAEDKPGHVENGNVEAEVVETEKPHEDEGEGALTADNTTLSSTIVSETTDAKPAATTSPSEASPLQAGLPWSPFEFRSNADVADFNSARPMGEDIFRHKKSLSATAKPFTPGAGIRSISDEADDDKLDNDNIIPSTEQDEDLEDQHDTAELPLVSTLEASLAQAVEERLYSSPPRSLSAEKPKGLAASRYASSPPPPPPPPKDAGLSRSRLATSPTASRDGKSIEAVHASTYERSFQQDGETQGLGLGLSGQGTAAADHEPTFEEIDDIMRHLNENDPAQGVNKTIDSSAWQQPLPTTEILLPDAANVSPVHIAAPSPSRNYDHIATHLARQPMQSTELEDPFVDPPQSAALSFNVHELVPKRRGSGGSIPVSEWERDFTDEEQLKLESRVNFFDGHVNDVMGSLLAARLVPLEKTLERIQHSVSAMTRGTPSSRRALRSVSGEIRESDADDEDDEMPPPAARRSMSPRKDRRSEQIRTIVMDALASHRQNVLSENAQASGHTPAVTSLSDESLSTILKSLNDVKEQFGQSLRLDFRGEDLRNIVEDAVERRMPPTPQPVTAQNQGDDNESNKRAETLQARVTELEDRLRFEETKMETEVSLRRAADDQAAELRRKLELAETKIEVEIMNRSAYDQRVADLEDRLKHQDSKAEAELEARRAAEDRLSEVQRLLRIASEEEMRLREAVDEREEKLKVLGDTSGQSKMRLAELEAAQANGDRTHSDLQNRLNGMETELRDKSQEARHWRSEAERAIDLSQRQGNDLVQTTTELRHLKRVVDTLGTQLEENENLREAWRHKFVSLQEEMARAAREVADESARHIKREQMLLARQEVQDAQLQAEARTRERLESELVRLEGGERQAMRAVAECKRLEAVLSELRTENEKLQRSSIRYQAEFEEARDSAAREVQRTRDAMQAEVDQANNQVNVVRSDLEDHLASVRSQLDQAKLEADTGRARLEMLLEEAETTKKRALEEAENRRRNEVEDLEARYERQLSNATEDGQRAEQNLLERLSISTSKTEHLQDRVAHLEEKLEIAREAAQAAAKAAKTGAPMVMEAAAIPAPATAGVKHHGLGLPEKISPQALRESIMVLQEQLQQREQRIEELEHTLSKLDPEADIKIAKRDDEILWLRELLAVRHSDLRDIITALGRNDHDPDRVRDAVIRLDANLQMEEQERERAVNGGSAIKLPTLAASIRDAATPRVAQAVGPLAAAWGNWRKGRDSNASTTFGSLSGVLSTPAPASASRAVGSAKSRVAATPSRGSREPSSSISSRTGRAPQANGNASGDSSFLSGLLTPPTTGMRQTPPSRQSQLRQQGPEEDQQQPTAFSSTGRRYTGEQLTGRRISRTDNKLMAEREMATTPPPNFRGRGQPVTPPMMRTAAYDSDAQAGDFDDAAFFDD